MSTDSAGFHESTAELEGETQDLHRALVSLREELEAIDWYQQRIDAALDPDLKDILRHNRDEEKEHAAMLLEWLRRRDAVFERVLRLYLFSAGPITALEADRKGDSSRPPASGLTVGSLIGVDVALPMGNSA
ncbi:MAG: encapsulin-associated ferritin-like protein [Acidiferrobacteraceae bacterium]